MAASSVSVVIPTHDRAALVSRAVASALAAVAEGDEVLVVDDGSTDGTAAVLAALAPRVRVVSSAERRGPGAARNLGVAHARHPLVAFLDSDDEWMPDKLRLQRALMDGRPDVVLSFSDFGHRDRGGVETRRCLAAWHRDGRPWSEILGPAVPFSTLAPLPRGRADFLVHVGDLYPVALHGDYVCTSTAVVRRDLAGGPPWFPEDLAKYEDWECFARLARRGPAAYLDCETQWNCDHAGARLTRNDDLDDETARLTVLDRVWGRDAGFLAGQGRSFAEVMARRRRARARALIARGRTAEARQELRRAGRASLAERVAAWLPGLLARAVVDTRRRLRATP